MAKLQKLNKPGSSYLFAYINADRASDNGWDAGDEVDIEISDEVITLRKVR